MRTHFLISITTMFLCLQAKPDLAQNPRADSIYRLLKYHVAMDTAKARLMLEYAVSSYPAFDDSSDKYSELGYSLSKKLNYPAGIMRGLNFRAIKAFRSNHLDEALVFYRESLKIANAENDMGFQAKILLNIGLVFKTMGKTDTSQVYLQKSLVIAMETRDEKMQAKCYTELGNLARIQGRYIQSIKYLLQALAIYEKAGSLNDLVVTHIQLGSFYNSIRDFSKSRKEYMQARKLNDSLKNGSYKVVILHNLGLLYLDVKKDQDSAKLFLLETYKLAQKTGNKDVILTTTLNLGNISFNKKEYDTALKYFFETSSSPQLQGRLHEQAALFVNIGTVYLKKGELEKSEKFLIRGYEIARSNRFIEFMQKAQESLATLVAKKSRYREAYDYLAAAAALNDSISGMEMRNHVSELRYQYELDKMESQNKLLLDANELQQEVIYRQRIIVIGSIAVVLLIVILLIIIFRSRVRLKKLNLKLDKQNHDLITLNHTKDKFFSIIAHDLKSPFNALLGLLSELDESYDEFNEDMRRRIISDLKKSSFNTYNLLVNLLDWAIAQRGHLENNAARINLKSVVNEAFALLQTRAAVKSQSLINEIQEEIQVLTDPVMLNSILINLVNNGIKFTPAGGKISVTAQSEGKMVRIRVEDTGIGIPGDEIQNLFRIDAQFKRQGTEKEPGTGLGLILCKEYLKIIGGEISVSSILGKGTTFDFTVPAGE